MLFHPGNTILGLEFNFIKHLYRRVEWLANTEDEIRNLSLGEKVMLLTQTRFSIVSIEFFKNGHKRDSNFPLLSTSRV